MIAKYISETLSLLNPGNLFNPNFFLWMNKDLCESCFFVCLEVVACNRGRAKKYHRHRHYDSNRDDATDDGFWLA